MLVLRVCTVNDVQSLLDRSRGLDSFDSRVACIDVVVNNFLNEPGHFYFALFGLSVEAEP